MELNISCLPNEIIDIISKYCNLSSSFPQICKKFNNIHCSNVPHVNGYKLLKYQHVHAQRVIEQEINGYKHLIIYHSPELDSLPALKHINNVNPLETLIIADPKQVKLLDLRLPFKVITYKDFVSNIELLDKYERYIFYHSTGVQKFDVNLMDRIFTSNIWVIITDRRYSHLHIRSIRSKLILYKDISWNKLRRKIVLVTESLKEDVINSLGDPPNHLIHLNHNERTSSSFDHAIYLAKSQMYVYSSTISKLENTKFVCYIRDLSSKGEKIKRFYFDKSHTVGNDYDVIYFLPYYLGIDGILEAIENVEYSNKPITLHAYLNKDIYTDITHVKRIQKFIEKWNA